MDFSKEGFKAWLRWQKPDNPVGVTGTPDSCAFAQYLKSQGAVHVSVMPGSGVRADGEVIPVTPLWLTRFIQQFDVDARDNAAEVKPVSFALECLFRAELAIEAENQQETHANSA